MSQDKLRPRYGLASRERSMFTKAKPEQGHDADAFGILRKRVDRNFAAAKPRSFTDKIVRNVETAPRSSGKGRALAASTRDYHAQCEAIMGSVRKLTESVKRAYAAGQIDKALRLKAKREEQLEKLELMTLERFASK